MKIVSLFSGAGGLDLGFIKAGHEVVWANDFFKEACLTYKKNIGDHIVCADISSIPSDEIPDHDLLIGGFPCQGFSVANTKRNKNDSRNALYLQLLRVLKEKKPKYFLAENVKGILSLEKGEVFRIIVKDFEASGYSVKFKLLNAADYGVPQKRERVIIIGIKKGCNLPEVTFPEPTHSSLPEKGLKKWVSIGKALSKIPDPDKDHALTNHTYSKFKLKFNGYIGNRFVDPDQPAPTVTARGDEKGGVVVLHHPSNMRRMTARELASTQSFPLEFEFIGNRSCVYRQIGNAVPPQLAFAVAKCFPQEV
jgi:DNA (cytosine-5)-methyltransferase 1